MMPLLFAWRSLVRQPARTLLGVLGVTAVGALLFDMLLLSQGMIVSMGELLDRTGYDVRVTTTAELPRTAPRVKDASGSIDGIRRLPEVRTALGVRFADISLERGEAEPLTGTFQGIIGPTHPWTVLKGRDIDTASGLNTVVVNRTLADALQIEPGATLTVTVTCESDVEVLAPIRLKVDGVVTLPFELTGERAIGGRLETLDNACAGHGSNEADILLVASLGKPDATAAAIDRLRPDLRAATNAQMLGRIEQGGFTYFRQISTVLTSVTVAFALLLISVLLTVSVNQRLGEIAALRALGFSRRRVVADVLCESALIVGAGGIFSLPSGLLLASALDRILTRMPNLPANLHFFVFEPGALGVHLALLVVTAIMAAAYPMSIVARLPIAATLRNEVIS